MASFRADYHLAVAVSPENFIRHRVLRALALDRTPGYHFAGNFLDISFDEVSSAGARLSFEPGAHCVDAHGEAELGAAAMLADLAIGMSVRAGLGPTTRLATVSMTLELSDKPRTGVIEAVARLQGFIGEGYGSIGRSSVALRGAGGEIAFGSGAFMVLKPPPGAAPPPVPQPRRWDAPPAELDESALEPQELRILRHAEAMLERAASKRAPFVHHFWGFLPEQRRGGASCLMPNGPHVGNRVGNVQGGILIGLAAATARAALPPSWMLTGISAAFVGPGQGAALSASSSVLHHGRLTSVVRTEITRRDGARVLEAMTTHAHRHVP